MLKSERFMPFGINLAIPQTYCMFLQKNFEIQIDGSTGNLYNNWQLLHWFPETYIITAHLFHDRQWPPVGPDKAAEGHN